MSIRNYISSFTLSQSVDFVLHRIHSGGFHAYALRFVSVFGVAKAGIHRGKQTVARGDKPASVQVTKEAFLHDAEQNCYWCPAGQKLKYSGTSREPKRRHGKTFTIERNRYEALVPPALRVL